MSSPTGMTWLYVKPTLTEMGPFQSEALDRLTERDKIDIAVPALATRTLRHAVDRDPVDGIVFEMARGWPGRHQLVASVGLVRRHRIVFYWPEESAAEVIDRKRLLTYLGLWSRAMIYSRRHAIVGAPRTELDLLDSDDRRVGREVFAQAELILADPRPVHLKSVEGGRITGTGVYLRTDYWGKLETGGSYGHTCYVAKELSQVTDEFVCLMANRFDLLRVLGVRQVCLQSPSSESSEEALLAASPSYNLQVRPVLEALQPAYIYERLCLGNLSGAQLCRELGIPYLVEYNGSEISMRRSFEGSTYENADLFELIEDAAFAQASVVSVVSEVIRDSLVARGVDPHKILVNPNGVDPDSYSPATPSERVSVRNELGFTDEDVVIGFTGTFGGWHGIDVLAESIPAILERHPHVAFLLIGDGPNASLIEDVVRKPSIDSRVVRVGRVRHVEGARLMRACDLFVSPHSAHMIDSAFFGSPTKLFEYMAMAKGIVASDLGQIGKVLSPSLRATDIAGLTALPKKERAVVCQPSDVSDFVNAVSALVERPDVADRLGRNAREAVTSTYAWHHHVARLVEFAAERSTAVYDAPAAVPDVDPEDEAPGTLASDEFAGSDHDGQPVRDYKTEVQLQWNSDPCGSQFGGDAEEHSLDWFLTAQKYRYDEYAPWMARVMEFDSWAGRDVLELGGGMGTDLAQFAAAGARTTDYDLTIGHLSLARENFALRGLPGRFVRGDCEVLPFADNSFDLVYSNGVLHHTPGTVQAVKEIHRVLRPNGRAVIMMYAEMSLHYWRNLVGELGLRGGLLEDLSIGEIMSRSVEMSTSDARPLVKVYRASVLREMFTDFDHVKVHKYQLTEPEKPAALSWVPASVLGRIMGWNLVVKADKAPAA